MSNGIIYLIQPPYLIGINRYKIGYSKIPDLLKCLFRFKKGTRCIYIMECTDPGILEKKIIEEFNKSFKLIAGNKCYEGDESLIKTTFLNIIIMHEENINNNLKKYGSDSDSNIFG